MGVEFRTLHQQVSILQSRGLTVDDEEGARNFLARSNYYDVVNGYASFFQPRTDVYSPGARFSELSAVYEFDKSFKAALFRMIEAAEAFLRSQIAYYFSKNHPEPWAYLHYGNFDKEKHGVADLFSKLNKIISSNYKPT